MKQNTSQYQKIPCPYAIFSSTDTIFNFPKTIISKRHSNNNNNKKVLYTNLWRKWQAQNIKFKMTIWLLFIRKGVKCDLVRCKITEAEQFSRGNNMCSPPPPPYLFCKNTHQTNAIYSNDNQYVVMAESKCLCRFVR